MSAKVKDEHTIRLEQLDRETFEYVEARCKRLAQYGITVEYLEKHVFRIRLTETTTSRISALKRAEDIARMLGFEK